jgi:hypothetical protein
MVTPGYHSEARWTVEGTVPLHHDYQSAGCLALALLLSAEVVWAAFGALPDPLPAQERQPVPLTWALWHLLARQPASKLAEAATSPLLPDAGKEDVGAYAARMLQDVRQLMAGAMAIDTTTPASLHGFVRLAAAIHAFAGQSQAAACTLVAVAEFAARCMTGRTIRHIVGARL